MIEVLRTDGRGNVMAPDDFIWHQEWVAEGKRARAERYVANHLCRAMHEPHRWPDLGSIRGISDHQMAAVSKALSSTIGMFIGGPGTGKSHVTAAVVRALSAITSSIGIAATTNKAAVRLTQALEANGVGPVGSSFKTGDKVICTDNGKYDLAGCEWDACGESPTECDDDGKVFVANGEFGKVVDSQEKLIVVQFSHPARLVKFPKGKSDDGSGGDGGDAESKDGAGGTADSDDAADGKTNTGVALDLAYACTVWKMQGSECPVAVPVLDDGSRNFGREGFFTAISRGKTCSLPVGKRATADGFCRKPMLGKRKTFLKELLVQGRELMRAELERQQVSLVELEAAP